MGVEGMSVPCVHNGWAAAFMSYFNTYIYHMMYDIDKYFIINSLHVPMMVISGTEAWHGRLPKVLIHKGLGLGRLVVKAPFPIRQHPDMHRRTCMERVKRLTDQSSSSSHAYMDMHTSLV